MKKNISLIAFLIIALNTSAQIDNFNVLSPDWLRAPARNAATDAADIVAYNPAGLTSLKEGLHINAGNVSLFRKPSHSYNIGLGEQKFEQSGSDAFVPNLYLAYNKSDWAFFTGLFIVGGGAVADYPTGSITTDLIGYSALGAAAAAGADYSTIVDPSFKASSYYLAIPFGVTYKFGQYFSASVGARTISATNKVESSITMGGSAMGLPNQKLGLDAEYTASGFGWVFAFNSSSNENYNLSVRLETQVDLEFETKTTKDDFGIVSSGAKSQRDLPAVLAFGLAINASPKLKVLMDVDLYFQNSANWDSVMYNSKQQSLSKLAGNSEMYSIAMQYQATTKLNIGAGLTFTDFTWKNQTAYYNTNLGSFETVPATNYTLNLGLRYNFTEKIAATLAYMNAIYAKDKQIRSDAFGTMVTVNNSASVVGIGVNLSF